VYPEQTLVASGGTPPYSWSVTAGSLPPGLSLSAAGTISGTPSSSAGSPYGFTATVTDGTGDSASQDFSISVNASPPPGPGIQSDDFSGEALDTGLWDFINPDGDVVLTMTGTQARLELPAAGFGRDFWSSATVNRMPRIMQPAGEGDFELEAKFESAITTTYQVQGILIEEGPLSLMRIEFLYYNQPRIFVASVRNGTAVTRTNTVLPSGAAPKYLRVRRAGNTWTVRHSSDGSNWSTAASFTEAFDVSAVGVYAANSATTAHTAVVDYFFNTASPIVPEDGG
jgi:regulation of enolase protein 1 (concanavalin A-like superfamily)